MLSGEGRYRRKIRKISRSRQVADCAGLLHTAAVTASRKQIRTADYPPDARARLGDAAVKARTAAGYQYRTDLVDAAKAAGEKLSVRSVQAVEQGDPTVGQAVLYALGRLLPNWTEDTPRSILDGGRVPPTAAESPTFAPTPDGSQEFPPALRERWQKMTVDEILDRGVEIGETLGAKARIRYLRAALQEKEDQMSREDSRH